MVPVQRYLVIAAAQRLVDQLGAELDQVLANLVTGAREAVEGVEVDLRGDDGDGSGVSVSVML